jgi:uracil-DNA glycosylase family 4
MENHLTLEQLQQIILNCHKCPLAQTRQKAVPGNGNIHAKIMLVGEGPGAHEDSSGVAFVGPAGILLDKIMKSVNLTREQVYLTNIVKCFPPENRVPRISEQDACIDYLRKEFLLMRPKLIVCLGSVAAKKLIDPSFSVLREHGRVIEKKGVLFIATFHPAALLRDENKKPAAWEDWKVIQKTIESSHLA